MKYIVRFSRRAQRDLTRLPEHILSKLKVWARAVELVGLAEVRKRSGFHDEPLLGQRDGQRSVRLNRSYRVIYWEAKGTTVTVVNVIEVTKHDY